MAKVKGPGERGGTTAPAIGHDVPPPTRTGHAGDGPSHGWPRCRGQTLQAVVVSARMPRTVVVERESLHYVPKFERYERRTRRMLAHAPPCLGLAPGHKVVLLGARPPAN